MQHARNRLLLSLAVVMLLAPGLALASPMVWYQIGDGQIYYVSEYKTDNGSGPYNFDFSDTGNGYAIQGNFTVQSDPYIAWGLSVSNTSNSTMTFTTGVLDNVFSAPITSSNHVYGSISASVTDIMGDGVTLAPVNTKLQTTTLNSTTNMGVDVGNYFHVGSGFPGQSYVVPADAKGPMLGPIGPWNSMQVEAKFTLSKHDIATLNGFSSINPVPEPGTLLLVGSGLLGLAVWRRRKLV